MRGFVASYRKIDKANGKLLNLESRINQCRTERMGAEPLRYESEELLALTAYIARQSLGTPIATRIDGAARAHFEAVPRSHHTRPGAMNPCAPPCPRPPPGKHWPFPDHTPSA